jgi:hypothetical protein
MRFCKRLYRGWLTQAILKSYLGTGKMHASQKIVWVGNSITTGDGIDGGYNYPSYLKKLLF